MLNLINLNLRSCAVVAGVLLVIAALFLSRADHLTWAAPGRHSSMQTVPPRPTPTPETRPLPSPGPTATATIFPIRTLLPPREEEAEGMGSLCQIIDLSVGKTVDNPRPWLGQTITFTVVVTNSGLIDASNVVVSDTLPAGLALKTMKAGAGYYDPETGLWRLNTLTRTQSVTLNLTARVTETGRMTNTAELMAASPEGDIDSTPANGLEREDDQDSLILTAFLPAASPPPASSEALAVLKEAVPPDLAGVVDDLDEPPVIMIKGEPVEIEDLRRLCQIDLSLTKQIDDPAPRLEQTIAFTIVVTNSGLIDAPNVVVSETIPAGLALAGATTSAGRYNPETGLWRLDLITRTESVTLNLAAVVTRTGLMTNTAEIMAAGVDDVDSIPANGLEREDDQDTLRFEVSSLAAAPRPATAETSALPQTRESSQAGGDEVEPVSSPTDVTAPPGSNPTSASMGTMGCLLLLLLGAFLVSGGVLLVNRAEKENKLLN